jgi:hypothetical protein
MMEPSFEKLLVLLAEGKVEFIVVGGIAVSIQGYVRFTEDVDILIDDSVENKERLLHVLASYGEGFVRELTVDDFTDEEGAIRIIEEIEQCQIDIFTRMNSRKYGDVVTDADSFSVSGYCIKVASKASLIGWKSKSTREKDRIDAMALSRLQDDPNAFD